MHKFIFPPIVTENVSKLKVVLKSYTFWTKFTEVNSNHGSPNFHGNRLHPLLWAGSRTAREKQP